MKILKISVMLLFAATLVLPFAFTSSVEGQSATEAPTGMDTLTNGFVDQATHDGDRDTFEERDDVTKGLGPIFNAQSCAECHQNTVTGAISQVTELRAGHNDAFGNFVAATVTINDGGGLQGVTIANRSRCNDPACCRSQVTRTSTRWVSPTGSTQGKLFQSLAELDRSVMTYPTTNPARATRPRTARRTKMETSKSSQGS